MLRALPPLRRRLSGRKSSTSNFLRLNRTTIFVLAIICGEIIRYYLFGFLLQWDSSFLQRPIFQISNIRRAPDRPCDTDGSATSSSGVICPPQDLPNHPTKTQPSVHLRYMSFFIDEWIQLRCFLEISPTQNTRCVTGRIPLLRAKAIYAITNRKYQLANSKRPSAGDRCGVSHALWARDKLRVRRALAACAGKATLPGPARPPSPFLSVPSSPTPQSFSAVSLTHRPPPRPGAPA